MVDVAVIGAGVTGAAIARALSRYHLRICVVDAAADVAMGASRANSAIVHAGYDAVPGSLMAKLNVEGNALFDEWCGDLHVPLGRCGSFVLAFEQKDVPHLEKLLAYGEQNGVPGLAIISGEEVRRLEPAVNPGVIAALYAPTGGITCPYELTQALCENAAANGAAFRLNSRVKAIEQTEAGFSLQFEKGEPLHAAYVVNAAGVYADDIARMIGDHSFRITPRRGEYMLLDRAAGMLVTTVIFQPPSDMGKGVLVSPTVDGNVFAGPTAANQQDKEDSSTTAEGLAELRRMSLLSVPQLPLSKVITSFSGVRAVADTGDFVLRPSAQNGRFLHAAGICSPGLSSAPAIGLYMAALLRKAGLPMTENPGYNPQRPRAKAFRHMSQEEREQAIAENPLYKRIICRCETVTEAEVVDAIRRAPGATTMDGVKRRVRAGMGRCQGGFCAPRVLEILARELRVPVEDVTKFGGRSYMLHGGTKQ